MPKSKLPSDVDKVVMHSLPADWKEVGKRMAIWLRFKVENINGYGCRSPGSRIWLMEDFKQAALYSVRKASLLCPTKISIFLRGRRAVASKESVGLLARHQIGYVVSASFPDGMT
jgi:hypothetical protein